MASLMLAKGDDKSTYEDWAKKLQSVYQDQAKQITDAYTSSATK